MRFRLDRFSSICALLMLWLASSWQIAEAKWGSAKVLTPKQIVPRRLLNENSFSLENHFQIADDSQIVEPPDVKLRQNLEALQQVLLNRREIGDKVGIADIVNKIGAIHIRLKEYPQALDFHQQALAIYKEIGDRQGEANTFGYIGNAYFNAGQYRQVEELFRQKLESLRKIGDRSGENIILEVMRRYLKEEWYFHAAYGTAAHGRVSRLWRRLKSISWQEQLEITQLNLFINREIGDRKGEEGSLHGLGWVYRSLGQYSRALESYQKSLAIARERGIKDHEAFLLVEIGLLYSDLGQYDRALEFIQKSLSMLASVQPSNELAVPLAYVEQFALNNAGLVYEKLGQYNTALQFLEKAYLKPGFDNHNILNNIGSVYFRMGEYADALAAYQEALKFGGSTAEPSANGFALNNIGFIHAQKREYTQALEHYRKALAIFKQFSDRPGEGLTLSNMGEAFLKQGNLLQATENLQAAIEVLESLRSELSDANKVSIFETQVRTYRILQQVLIAQNKIDAALEIAERGRLRAFVELLAKRLSSNPNPQPKIAPLTIAEIKRIAKEQKATLVEYSIITDTFEVEGRPKSQESELFIWVIQPTGDVGFRRVDLKSLRLQKISLADLVVSSRDSIGVRGRGIAVVATAVGRSEAKKLQQLHQLLIQPIADLLPNESNSRVIFFPQGELFLVPFAALQDSSGKYLVEKHTILTAPAIQVLDLTRKQRQRVSGKDVLIVGNPTMPSISTEVGQPPQQLPSLPGAEREAVAIASIFGTKPLIGKDATKISILERMPSAKIIHLATHGLLDDFKGVGVPGAVALSPSGNDDGLLTASEILSLKLNAELVVLSACDTGRGKITGDGVIGLSRSLISAGVPSVVVSLWSVPDAPTASLMAEFYQNLQKQPDKSQALRQAMLTTMKKYPIPRDWAAFTLIGEAE